jgi:GST-like protein
MIDLYTWTTPNGRKVSILLEELGVEYTVHSINITKDEQFAPEFLAIAPNNRIPAIVDNENNITMMESGSIMQYMAEKTGKLLSTDSATRWKTIEWLNWQMGGLGPMAGQTHHFVKFNAGKSQYAVDFTLRVAGH